MPLFVVHLIYEQSAARAVLGVLETRTQCWSRQPISATHPPGGGPFFIFRSKFYPIEGGARAGGPADEQLSARRNLPPQRQNCQRSHLKAKSAEMDSVVQHWEPTRELERFCPTFGACMPPGRDGDGHDNGRCRNDDHGAEHRMVRGKPRRLLRSIVLRSSGSLPSPFGFAIMPRKSDPFESPERRLKRGKEHTRRLKKRIDSFFKKKPYKRVADMDAEGVTTHAFKSTRNFPNGWADATVEALEALRSTLDQIGYAVAVLAGAIEPKNAYFPIADTASGLDSVVKGRCKDLPAEIATLFRSFDAHEGGNYTLWALNKLCNANKHRLLIPIGTLVPEMNVARAVIQDTDILAPCWNSSKNQIEFARVHPGGEFKYDVQISFFIGFDEFNSVKPAPAVGMLNAIAGEVQRVLVATEAECRRLNLL
jgi:hypothetical protein